jgi:LmbE family N-acetylglucosaminyl deacetylase
VTDYVETKLASLRHHVSQIADMEAMAARVRERMRDPEAPDDEIRYIERFRVVRLA